MKTAKKTSPHAALHAVPQNRMRPVHPGEILREEYLEPLGVSSNALAHALGVPTNRVTEIVREKRAVTAETALRLAQVLNTTPEFWLNLQMTHDLRLAQSSPAAKKISSIPPMRLSLHA